MKKKIVVFEKLKKMLSRSKESKTCFYHSFILTTRISVNNV